LIHLLHEEANFPKGTDHSLLAKCHTTHADHPSYCKPKTAIALFGVKHFAGEVTYQIEGFLEKNRDTLRQDITDMIAGSKHELLAQWFASPPDLDVSSSSLALDRNHQRSFSGNTSGLGSSNSSLQRTTTISRKGAKAPTTGYQFHDSLVELIETLTQCTSSSLF
jgi:myosin-15